MLAACGRLMARLPPGGPGRSPPRRRRPGRRTHGGARGVAARAGRGCRAGRGRVAPAEVPGLVAVPLELVQLVFAARRALEIAEERVFVAGVVVEVLPDRRPGSHADPELPGEVQAVVDVRHAGRQVPRVVL